MLHITINGYPCENFGLTPLKGTLSELMKPAAPKEPVKNTNKDIHGDVVALYHGKVQSRTVTLFFYIQAGNELIDLQAAVDYLDSKLRTGTNGKGDNVLFVEELGKYYHLYYEGMSEYATVGESNRATLRIKFYEPNPLNNAE